MKKCLIVITPLFLLIGCTSQERYARISKQELSVPVPISNVSVKDGRIEGNNMNSRGRRVFNASAIQSDLQILHDYVTSNRDTLQPFNSQNLKSGQVHGLYLGSPEYIENCAMTGEWSEEDSYREGLTRFVTVPRWERCSIHSIPSDEVILVEVREHSKLIKYGITACGQFKSFSESGPLLRTDFGLGQTELP